MENDKQIVINAAEGTTEIVVREGQAAKVLDPKAPLAYNVNGLIGSVTEYLRKRIDAGQFEQKNCTLYVNREDVKMTLIFNERDEYNKGSVSGELRLHPDFEALMINRNYAWVPMELAQLMKMHRYWFTDRTEGMKLVSTLMNYKADITQKVEQSAEANGGRTDNFAQVVNSNLPQSITLNLPIFKGAGAQPIEIEFFAKVNGREVEFVLLSPGANEALEAYRDAAIDKELEEIRKIAPEIAIIEQ